MKEGMDPSITRQYSLKAMQIIGSFIPYSESASKQDIRI